MESLCYLAVNEWCRGHGGLPKLCLRKHLVRFNDAHFAQLWNQPGQHPKSDIATHQICYLSHHTMFCACDSKTRSNSLTMSQITLQTSMTQSYFQQNGTNYSLKKNIHIFSEYDTKWYIHRWFQSFHNRFRGPRTEIPEHVALCLTSNQQMNRLCINHNTTRQCTPNNNKT